MPVAKYSEKLKDPRWQKKRLKILERDEWHCQKCFDDESTLVVHHRLYLPNAEPWDYPDELLITLCESCHEYEGSERHGNESDLLSMIRRNFLADDIHTLAAGFHQLKLLHIPGVVAGAYELALSDETIQRDLIDRYFKMLEEQAKNKKKEPDAEG